MAVEGAISMTVSQAIIDETLDVLGRKFGASLDDLAEARAIILEATRMITPTVQLDVIKEDPSDNRILECAVTAGSNYVVTGDNDLLWLRHYDAIRIIRASDLVEVLHRYDGTLAVDATYAVLNAFGAAILRYERPTPDRCPRCSSLRIEVMEEPEFDSGLAIACESCGAIADVADHA